MVTVGIVAPGAMGSAVAQRLREHGARVLTLLEGRSPATRTRAAAAGMEASDPESLAEADMILSIVPPAEATSLAEQMAPMLRASARKAVYIDCNALDVRTVRVVGQIIEDTGALFVDGGIIGFPPKSGNAGPKLYLSGGPAASIADTLSGLGFRAVAMEGPVGAASALKMSYAGITKGLAAIASMMVLGADRAGAGPALRAELASSQPELLSRFSTTLPDMIPKAYRWVAEMREIAAFLQEDAAGSAVFDAIAQFYDRIAADAVGHREESRAIERFATKGN